MSIYPKDKNGRIVRKGDFVIVDFVYDAGRHHERCVGIINGYAQKSWYGPWILHVVFYDGENFESCTYEVPASRAEWITKRRRIRERKMMILKLESL